MFKYIILIPLLIVNVSLSASSIMTVEQYKRINDTSPSIQDGIRSYHKKAVTKKMDNSKNQGIFYFKKISDGSDKNGNYNTFFETPSGNEGVTMGTWKMQFGFGGKQGVHG